MDKVTGPTNHRFKNALISKRFLGILLILGAIGLSTAVAYNAGVKHGQATTKKIPKSLTDLSSMYNKNPNATSSPAPTANKVTRNSGFYRLVGTVQTPKKDTFQLKLEDGSIITLAYPKNQTYFNAAREKKPVAELKAGVKITAVGTIGATGTFTTSSIQVQN